MSVSPFSVQHDYEVQAFNQLRARYLMAEKSRKEEEKVLKKAFKNDRRMSLQTEGEAKGKKAATLKVLMRVFRTAPKERKRDCGLDEDERRHLVDDSDSDEISLKQALE
ncbi:uncharacterized protein Z518_01339 [Rhinocladiella mackenziei CBS 650.93]|uniref:Rhinocladiella mackenziei CBS 650.93 unplaced genomic scaffold supercont1.1, whole genome shotgun sequence n=1 Tax=Rhinocladiella mackenziei CBS 650.93 TaxID=1442369 RepID=A0A0D2HHU1_9EURO|nr:uncharacterized protein Z518_01339 [Rhinocladiella mackenziei CBS 650.93]KIX10258.1 hypothetical protein Z518_01339 [Rhinocladiella mackenziei CBS 650.93]